MTAKSQAEIAGWCVDYLARLLERPPESIEADAPFARVGLDSAMALYFTIDLEKWLGIEVWPEIVFEHPSIARLSAYLAAQTAKG